MTSEKKKVFGLSFLSVFLWASAFPLTKVAQQQFTSISSGFSALYGRSNFSDYHREMLSHSACRRKSTFLCSLYPAVLALRAI